MTIVERAVGAVTVLDLEGKLTLGGLLYTSVKPRWIYHSMDTIAQLSKLRSALRAQMGTGFVPGAWEPYAKGEKFDEVGAALAEAFGMKAAKAA